MVCLETIWKWREIVNSSTLNPRLREWEVTRNIFFLSFNNFFQFLFLIVRQKKKWNNCGGSKQISRTQNTLNTGTFKEPAQNHTRNKTQQKTNICKCAVVWSCNLTNWTKNFTTVDWERLKKSFFYQSFFFFLLLRLNRADAENVTKKERKVFQRDEPSLHHARFEQFRKNDFYKQREIT